MIRPKSSQLSIGAPKSLVSLNARGLDKFLTSKVGTFWEVDSVVHIE